MQRWAVDCVSPKYPEAFFLPTSLNFCLLDPPDLNDFADVQGPVTDDGVTYTAASLYAYAMEWYTYFLQRTIDALPAWPSFEVELAALESVRDFKAMLFAQALTLFHARKWWADPCKLDVEKEKELDEMWHERYKKLFQRRMQPVIVGGRRRH
jgi:hypothetical protein